MYQSTACAVRRGRCLEGLGCPLSLASALLLSLGWSVLAAWWPGSGVRLWTEGAPSQRWQQPRLHALCDWDRPAGHSLDCHAYADLASVSMAERAVHTGYSDATVEGDDARSDLSALSLGGTRRRTSVSPHQHSAANTQVALRVAISRSSHHPRSVCHIDPGRSAAACWLVYWHYCVRNCRECTRRCVSVDERVGVAACGARLAACWGEKLAPQ